MGGGKWRGGGEDMRSCVDVALIIQAAESCEVIRSDVDAELTVLFRQRLVRS